MKKIFNLTKRALFLIICLAFIAGCSGSSGSSSDDDTGSIDTEIADDKEGTEETDDNDYYGILVINEIMAKDADGGNDWIEFYVSGTETINLSDYTVVDDNAENELSALPTVILSPGEFYVVRATDEAPEDGSAYVPFKLGSDDCVSLFKGDDLIDRLDWEDGDALIGYSYGCFPDGSENTQTLSPTSGYPNETADNESIFSWKIRLKTYTSPSAKPTGTTSFQALWLKNIIPRPLPIEIPPSIMWHSAPRETPAFGQSPR